MKKLFIILLSALSLTTFAQQKKVAVYVTGQESGINKVLGDQLVAAFAKSGKYIAIERTSSFLAELGKEQNYQRTGAVDDNELSRLGKQFGVQLVCVADVSDVFGQKYVSTRLIDVESAEVVSTGNVSTKLDSMEELMRVTNTLKGQLLGNYIDSKVPEGYIDLGLSSGTLWQKNSYSGRYNYSSALEICEKNKAKIPDLDLWNELINECTWTYKSGKYEVQGKNGNIITLHTFYRLINYNQGKYNHDTRKACYYWSSTTYKHNKSDHIYLLKWSDSDHYKEMISGETDTWNCLILVKQP